ncbi:MAG: hypothetical protein QM784_31915 [Polyangiaceae bacterium]
MQEGSISDREPASPKPITDAGPSKAAVDVGQGLRRTASQLARLSVQARDVAIDHADRLVAQLDGKLSPTARQKLQGVSPGARRWLFFAAVLLVAVLPVIVVAGVVKVARRHGAAVTSAQPSVSVAPPPAASPEPQIQPVVLDENSKDPEVLLALAKERLAANKEADALGFVIKALGRQPERRNDERVSAVLFRTADSLQRDLCDKTFSLLQGAMAGKGAEIQYQNLARSRRTRSHPQACRAMATQRSIRANRARCHHHRDPIASGGLLREEARLARHCG